MCCLQIFTIHSARVESLNLNTFQDLNRFGSHNRLERSARRDVHSVRTFKCLPSLYRLSIDLGNQYKEKPLKKIIEHITTQLRSLNNLAGTQCLPIV